MNTLKGQSREILMHVFFFTKQLILVPIEMFLDHLDFLNFWQCYKSLKVTLWCLRHRGVMFVQKWENSAVLVTLRSRCTVSLNQQAINTGLK